MEKNAENGLGEIVFTKMSTAGTRLLKRRQERREIYIRHTPLSGEGGACENLFTADNE